MYLTSIKHTKAQSHCSLINDGENIMYVPYQYTLLLMTPLCDILISCYDSI